MNTEEEILFGDCDCGRKLKECSYSGMTLCNMCEECGKNMTEENTRYDNDREEDVVIVCVDCFGEEEVADIVEEDLCPCCGTDCDNCHLATDCSCPDKMSEWWGAGDGVVTLKYATQEYMEMNFDEYGGFIELVDNRKEDKLRCGVEEEIEKVYKCSDCNLWVTSTKSCCGEEE